MRVENGEQIEAMTAQAVPVGRCGEVVCAYKTGGVCTREIVIANAKYLFPQATPEERSTVAKRLGESCELKANATPTLTN